jgi:hypothetical protein
MRALEPGERFGKLTVLEKAWETRRGPFLTVWYRLHCDCGEAHVGKVDRLLSGQLRSCGCASSGGRVAVQKRMDVALQKTLKAAECYEVPSQSSYKRDAA